MQIIQIHPDWVDHIYRGIRLRAPRSMNTLSIHDQIVEDLILCTGNVSNVDFCEKYNKKNEKEIKEIIWQFHQKWEESDDDNAILDDILDSYADMIESAD